MPASQARKVLVLSPCARDYARSLVNPFEGPTACIPNFPACMSRKVRVFSKGVFSTGTSGFGFILVDPLLAAINDQGSLWYSLSNYAGTTITDTVVVGTQTASSNSDYPIATIGPASTQVQVRVVSSGIRIRYIGTELNRGGQIVGLSEPTHDSLTNRSFVDLSGQERSRLIPVLDRNWVTLTYFPVQPAESEFSSDVVPASRPCPAKFMAFAVNAASSGTPLSYEYEFFTNLEYTGLNVRGLTPSHVDYVGFSAVHAVSQTSNHDRPHHEVLKRKEESFLEEIARYAGSALSWVGNNIGKVATVAGAALAAL